VLTDFALRITSEVADAERIAVLRLAIAAKDSFPDIARRLHGHIADTVAPITEYLTLCAMPDTGSTIPRDWRSISSTLPMAGCDFC